MRQFLTVAVLGASLFMTNAAFAEGNSDPKYGLPLQVTQSNTITRQDSSAQSVLADGEVQRQVWNDRENGRNR